MGPNGSGKTLVLKLMSGLLNPDNGIITHANKPASTNLPCGFVFQKPILLRKQNITSKSQGKKKTTIKKTQQKTKSKICSSNK